MRRWLANNTKFSALFDPLRMWALGRERLRLRLRLREAEPVRWTGGTPWYRRARQAGCGWTEVGAETVTAAQVETVALAATLAVAVAETTVGGCNRQCLQL